MIEGKFLTALSCFCSLQMTRMKLIDLPMTRILRACCSLMKDGIWETRRLYLSCQSLSLGTELSNATKNYVRRGGEGGFDLFLGEEI